MDPAEIEFLAESASSIGIVPNFSEGTLYLLEGDVGPFRAGQPLQVGHCTGSAENGRARMKL